LRHPARTFAFANIETRNMASIVAWLEQSAVQGRGFRPKYCTWKL